MAPTIDTKAVAPDNGDSKSSTLDSPTTGRFLRICLPADASSIAKVDFESTLWDIMVKVGPKRGCPPENHHVIVHTMDNNIIKGENNRTLGSYGAIDYIELIRNPDYVPKTRPKAKANSAAYVTTSGNGTSKSEERRKSINSTKHTNIRMIDYSFPTTVTDSNVLAHKLKVDNSTPGFSQFTGTLKKSNKANVKNLSMMLFKKHDNEDSKRNSETSMSNTSLVSLSESLPASPVRTDSSRPISLRSQLVENISSHTIEEPELETVAELPVIEKSNPRDSYAETLKSPQAESFSLGSFAFEHAEDDWPNQNRQLMPDSRDLLTPAHSTELQESNRASRPHREPPQASLPHPIDTGINADDDKSIISANINDGSAHTKSASQGMLTNVSTSLASIDTGNNSITSRPTSYLRRLANESDESRSPSTSSVLNDATNSTIKALSGEKIRKRTASTPVSAHGTLKKTAFSLESPVGDGFQYSTLKRPNHLKGGSRSRSYTDSRLQHPNIAEILGVPDSDVSSVSTPVTEEKMILKVNLPEQQVTRISIPKTSSMEEVLETICEKRNLEYDSFTLEVSIPGVNIEMDRPLSYYVDDLKATEVTVVRKEKTYSTMCISEDGTDVMILQIVNGKLQVMAGTVEKLIERLTDAELPDEEFLDTMLLTFRSFISPPEFFDWLVSRFNCELPENPSAEDVQYFAEMQIPTQKRVLLIFKWWVTNHYGDFAASTTLKADLEDFTKQVQEYNGRQYRTEASELQDLIEKQIEEFESNLSTVQTGGRRGKTIDGMVGEITTEDLAQQLAIHNFTLFKKIRPIEYLNQVWLKENNTSVHMQLFIDRSDKESYWVATEIVKETDLKKRIKLLSKFITAAVLSRDYQNFFSMFSIIAGLNMPPVQRLKKTWEGLPEKVKKSWSELEKLIDPSKNMKNFRDLLANAEGSIVPFLPIYLKDLIFMNDGNDSTIGKNKMINFDKLRMMGNRVMDIARLGNASYVFRLNPAIQNFISMPPIEKSMTKLKQLSLECES